MSYHEHFTRGINSFNNENWYEAVVEFSKALAINASCVDSYVNRGAAHFELSNLNAAMMDLNTAISITVHNPHAYYNRGMVKISLEDYRGAIADFDKAIKLNANASNFYSERGTAKLKLKDIDDAIVDFTKAIALDPGCALYYFNRAMAYLASEQAERGNADLQRAHNLGDPDALRLMNENAKRGKKEISLTEFKERVHGDRELHSTLHFQITGLYNPWVGGAVEFEQTLVQKVKTFLEELNVYLKEHEILESNLNELRKKGVYKQPCGVDLIPLIPIVRRVFGVPLNFSRVDYYDDDKGRLSIARSENVELASFDKTKASVHAIGVELHDDKVGYESVFFEVSHLLWNKFTLLMNQEFASMGYLQFDRDIHFYQFEYRFSKYTVRTIFRDGDAYEIWFSSNSPRMNWIAGHLKENRISR